MDKKTTSKIQENTLALIEQEWDLVLRGKHAEKLAELIHSYEMNILTSPLETNKYLTEKYAVSLLIKGDYLELGFFIARTKEILNKDKLFKIAQTGSKEQLKELGTAVKDYLQILTDPQLRLRIKEGTVHSILKILSKYFINFSFANLKSLIDATEDEVKQLGYNIEGGYVQLQLEEVKSDCLLTKLNQLAVVANKMSKLE